MKKFIAFCTTISILISCSRKNTETQNLFPKGEKITNNNFIGDVWLQTLTTQDSVYNTKVGAVTFSPGARTNWHLHKGGQALLIIRGKALYQEKGKPIQILNKGQIVECLPDVPHWHGATPTDTMTHIAITPNQNLGAAVWLEPVTEKEYNNYQ